MNTRDSGALYDNRRYRDDDNTCTVDDDPIGRIGDFLRWDTNDGANHNLFTIFYDIGFRHLCKKIRIHRHGDYYDHILTIGETLISRYY